MKRVLPWLRREWATGLCLASAMMIASGVQSQTFSYDPQGRVTSATYTDGTSIFYTYDLTGNRTQLCITSSSTCVPVAGAVSATVASGSSNNPITLSLSGNAATSVAVSTSASHGTATATGTAITYTPTSGYSGSDSFQYTASNSSGTSSPATASLTVTIANGTVLYTKTTSGTFSYTVPSGVSYVDIEIWGGGSDSSAFYVDPVGYIGIGGGGGGYAKKHISVTSGQVIAGAVAAGNASTASSVTSPALTANSSAPSSGTGGTASGGDVNTSGFACCGGTGYDGGGAGNGGGSQSTADANGTAPGGGGNGANAGAVGGTTGHGVAGRVTITARTS